MLISTTTKVKWTKRSKKYYEDLGYKFTKYDDEFEVKVKHLSPSSRAIVSWKCDFEGCNTIKTGEYLYYLKHVKEDGKIYCIKCSNKYRDSKNKNFYSFEHWCIDNNRLDLLNRWDYEKNKVKPSEVRFGTKYEYWFKCLAHPEHPSTSKSINQITNRNENVICCRCNSIMQYCIDNNCVDALNLKKNYDLGLDLWSIPKGSNVEIWFLCTNKEAYYHNDFGGYKRRCVDFYKSGKCPYCSMRKIHPKDSLAQYIIDNYGLDFFNKVWNWELNKNIDPFTIAPSGKLKIWWNCPDDKHEPFLRSCNGSKRFKYRCHKCVIENNSGENHHNWNPELTDEDRQERSRMLGYKDFVKQVMQRDYYMCQITGIKGNSKILVVHHLNSFDNDKENRLNQDNAILIHKDIHKLFHSIYGYGNNTKEQFEEFLMNIENDEIDISYIK